METKVSLPTPSVPVLRKLDLVHVSYSTSLRFILILFSHLGLGLLSGLLPSDFPTKTLCVPLRYPIRATRPEHLSLLDYHSFDPVYSR